MNDYGEWIASRNSRSLIYAERVLDPSKTVRISLPEAYAARADGQVFALTLANILSRMTPSISLDVPNVPIAESLPSHGTGLADCMRALMTGNYRDGEFATKECANDQFTIGPVEGAEIFAIGMGWNAIVASRAISLAKPKDGNPFGAGLAAIMAASHLFQSNFNYSDFENSLNTLTWETELLPPDQDELTGSSALGSLWVVGAGSVGTAALYFLAHGDVSFSTTLVDMDRVKVHNLDRSPIFTASDVGQYKVEATKRFLNSAGYNDVTVFPVSLDECNAWTRRTIGTPNFVLSAANERNVRQIIEEGLPPVQIYGTTGRNWQASLLRHEFGTGACSCCVFPPKDQTPPTECATAAVKRDEIGQQVDAALPFLSFGAGLLTASEIVKSTLDRYPFSSERVVLYFRRGVRATHSNIPALRNCDCQFRSQGVISAVRSRAGLGAWSLYAN